MEHKHAALLALTTVFALAAGPVRADTVVEISKEARLVADGAGAMLPVTITCWTEEPSAQRLSPSAPQPQADQKPASPEERSGQAGASYGNASVEITQAAEDSATRGRGSIGQINCDGTPYTYDVIVTVESCNPLFHVGEAVANVSWYRGGSTYESGSAGQVINIDPKRSYGS